MSAPGYYVRGNRVYNAAHREYAVATLTEPSMRKDGPERARLIARCLNACDKTITRAIPADLYADLIDYFDNRADGETIDGRESVNAEAKLLQRLREAAE